MKTRRPCNVRCSTAIRCRVLPTLIVHDIKAVGGQSAHACRQLLPRLLIDDLIAPVAAQEFGLLWRAARACDVFAAALLQKLHLDASGAATGSSDKANVQRLRSAQLADRHGSRWPAVATGTVHHHCIANGDALPAIAEAGRPHQATQDQGCKAQRPAGEDATAPHVVRNRERRDFGSLLEVLVPFSTTCSLRNIFRMKAGRRKRRRVGGGDGERRVGRVRRLMR